MLEHFSITWTDALAVVVATASLYWIFVLLVRLLGQRALARMSSTDLAVIIVVGAVIGRAALGYTPTLVAGILAMLTLFAMQSLAAGIRHRSEVAAVILEPTGEISVLRRGIPLDRSLLADVRGVEHLPDELFAEV